MQIRDKKGKSGEKYISFDKTHQKYKLIIRRGKKYFTQSYKNLEDAVICRDKYLEDNFD